MQWYQSKQLTGLSEKGIEVDFLKFLVQIPGNGNPAAGTHLQLLGGVAADMMQVDDVTAAALEKTIGHCQSVFNGIQRLGGGDAFSAAQGENHPLVLGFDVFDVVQFNAVNGAGAADVDAPGIFLELFCNFVQTEVQFFLIQGF